MKTYKNRQSGMVGHVEILAAIVIVGVIGFAGWRVMSKDKQPTNDTPQASVETQTEASVLPTQLTDIKSVDEIKTLATRGAGDLSITGVELEMEEGKAVYVVHFSDGSTQSFDAKTGTKLQLADNKNDDIDKTKNLPDGFVAGLTIQEAIDKAKAELPNQVVRKVEMKVEDGVVLYSVKFKNGGRVDVNAADGTIVKKVEGGQSNSGSSNSEHSNSGSSSSGSHEANDDDKDDDKSTSNSPTTNNETNDDKSTSSGSGSNNSEEEHSGSGGSNSGSGSSGHGGHGE